MGGLAIVATEALAVRCQLRFGHIFTLRARIFLFRFLPFVLVFRLSDQCAKAVLIADESRLFDEAIIVDGHRRANLVTPRTAPPTA